MSKTSLVRFYFAQNKISPIPSGFGIKKIKERCMSDIVLFYIFAFACSAKTLFDVVDDAKKGAFEVALLILGNNMVLAYSFVMLVRMLPHGQRILEIGIGFVVGAFVLFIVKEIFYLNKNK